MQWHAAMMFRGSASACPPSWPAPPGSDVGGDDRGGGDGAFSGSSTASEVLMFCGSTASSIPGGVAHQEDLEKYDMLMFQMALTQIPLVVTRSLMEVSKE